ncbi:Hypothetical protein AT6N2_L0592 [Agrobacterium tumefaciens]|nr:Hypothetical protein AT6N2_L0592 [Agrobacterium tumefaciens]
MRRRALGRVNRNDIGIAVAQKGLTHSALFAGNENQNPDKIANLEDNGADEGLNESRVERPVDEICRDGKGKQGTNHAEKDTRCIHVALLPRTISPLLTALLHFSSLKEIYDETGAVSTHIYFF